MIARKLVPPWNNPIKISLVKIEEKIWQPLLAQKSYFPNEKNNESMCSVAGRRGRSSGGKITFLTFPACF